LNQDNKDEDEGDNESNNTDQESIMSDKRMIKETDPQ
jgi:hypothetical protein